jgi:hypothetical protein
MEISMKKYIKPLMIVAAMSTAFSAMAIQKDITATCGFDSDVVLLHDGQVCFFSCFINPVEIAEFIFLAVILSE